VSHEAAEFHRSRIHRGRDCGRLGAVGLSLDCCAAIRGAARTLNAPISSGLEPSL